MGRDQLDPQLIQRPPKLTRGRHAGELLVHGGRGWRLVGRMRVCLHGQQNPIVLHIALEAVHCRDGALVRIGACKDPAVRIVDVGHQHVPGPAPLEPVMVRTIQLEECPHMDFPFPPRPMGPDLPREMIDPLRSQPPSKGLVAERDPVALGQLLGCQRRSKIPILLLAQLLGHGLALVRDPPVRWLPPSPMRRPLVARLLNPLDEAPDVPWRQPQHGARLNLRQRLLHRLANHRHPPEFLHTHDDPVLSDHSALRLKASSLATKRTCLLWQKRTLSLWDYRRL